MVHLAVYSANHRSDTLNYSLILGMFGSLAPYFSKDYGILDEANQSHWDARKNSHILSHFFPISSPTICQDVWGRRDFGLVWETLILDHHPEEAHFFSIWKTGLTFQTHHLQQDSCLHSCCLQQACWGSLFWPRQRIQQYVFMYHPPLVRYLNNFGEILDLDSVLTLWLQVDYMALKWGEWL